jgi:hypothetical protein
VFPADFAILVAVTIKTRSHCVLSLYIAARKPFPLDRGDPTIPATVTISTRPQRARELNALRHEPLRFLECPFEELSDRDQVVR